MYLGIDIGGTKTLVAALTNEGVIKEKNTFPTPKLYTDFLRELSKSVADLSTKEYVAVGVGAPGRIDRKKGIVIAFGNLSWKRVPLAKDIARLTNLPVALDNDANLAGLSEAMLIPHHNRVLYVTISTGIGTGVITNRAIDADFADSEGGAIMLEHKGRLQKWEDFASGRAIVKSFGKRASEIQDEKTWGMIADNIAVGLFDLLAFMQPDAVVMGGGVNTQFERFDDLLMKKLQRFETPLTPIPPIYKAQRPEDAVVYGCYDLAKSVYGSAH